MATSAPLPFPSSSDEQLRVLGRLLWHHRHRLGLSQESVANAAGIDASTYSKAERGVRKLSLDAMQRLVGVLKLTRNQEIELITTAGYDATKVIGSVPFDASSYPLVVGSVQERLTGARGLWPVWAANRDGNIVAANALSLLLWQAMHEDGTLAPERFLEANIWEIISRRHNMERILAPQKASDFFFTVIYVWNKLKHNVPKEVVMTFEQALETHPILSNLLHYPTSSVEQEWQFDLSIYQEVSTPSYDIDQKPLMFQITVERILDSHQLHTGYLYTARPLHRSTDNWIREKYDSFSKQEEFVYGEWDVSDKDAALKYPTFDPAVNHDELWNISLANSEFILLYGSDPTATGDHYFEMLLAPHFLKLLGGFEEAKEKLVIPVRQFIQSTKEFEYTDNPRHNEMMQIKTRLSRLATFQTLVNETLRTPPQPPVQVNGDSACFTIEMPCPLTDYFKLSFAVVTRRPTKSEKDYRVCFIPTTDATTVALVLMRLHHSEEIRQSVGEKEQDQYMWLLASLWTVREAFSKKKGDAWWYVEEQFKEFYHNLESSTFNLATLKTHIAIALSQLLYPDKDWRDHLFDIGWLNDKEHWQHSMTEILRTFTEPFKRAQELLP